LQRGIENTPVLGVSIYLRIGVSIYLRDIDVYYSTSSNLSKQQELKRKNRIQCIRSAKMEPEILTNELKVALIIFYSTLNEKQRRLYAGLESLKVGHGGDKFIAELLDIDQKTVAKGKRELLSEEVDVDTIRKSGGGRKKIKKKSIT
jgi:hypothetical protein